jgi:preprotein translocase subunit YajC
MPEVGRAVLIEYLATTVHGTVKEVADDGRRLEVETEDGATLTFELNRATARFTAGGGQTAPRLRFVPR